MRPIFEGVVKRTTLAKIVAAQFFIFLLLLGGGLQLVKEQARDYAVTQASLQGNQTTCVSTVILARIKASSNQAAKDKTTSKSVRARAKASADFWQLLLNHLKPVPPNLNCYRLLGIPEPT